MSQIKGQRIDMPEVLRDDVSLKSVPTCCSCLQGSVQVSERDGYAINFRFNDVGRSERSKSFLNL